MGIGERWERSRVGTGTAREMVSLEFERMLTRDDEGVRARVVNVLLMRGERMLLVGAE